MDPLKSPITVSSKSGNQRNTSNSTDRGFQIRSISRSRDGSNIGLPVSRNRDASSDQRPFSLKGDRKCSLIFPASVIPPLNISDSHIEIQTSSKQSQDDQPAGQPLLLLQQPSQGVNFFQKFRIKKTSAPNSPNLADSIRERYCMFATTLSRISGAALHSKLESRELEPVQGKVSDPNPANTIISHYDTSLLPSSQPSEKGFQPYDATVIDAIKTLQSAQESPKLIASADFTNQSTEVTQESNICKLSRLEQVLNQPEWQNGSITLNELYTMEHLRDSGKRASSVAMKPCLKKRSISRANISSVDKKVQVRIPHLQAITSISGQSQSSKLALLPKRTLSTPRPFRGQEEASQKSLKDREREDSNPKKKTVRFTRHALVLQF